ncbi:hypothetical protein ACDQ55_06930 [Chitinophaga sp. 30R24]|uniref:Abi-alpha family protein n=1 Tax=Chitinophaga sp. 30R24 TaxID=3248838 RepID=UPI003B8FD163
MEKKIDITSTAIEKGIDLAKDFLDKLIMPAIEETGLLIKEKVTYWKFKDQVKTLNKAKEYCDKNGISTKTISLKLLCPLLDGAALEEDEKMQDKWAILLSNLVDSKQNIQNHVLPYLLGQISYEELSFLEKEYQSKLRRVENANEELVTFNLSNQEQEACLTKEIEELNSQIKSERLKNSKYHDIIWPLQSKLYDLEKELKKITYSKAIIEHKISDPEIISEQELKEFEIANLVRLGMISMQQSTVLNSEPLEIPRNEDEENVKVDLDIDLETEQYYILTQLGELFIESCTEKKQSK